MKTEYSPADNELCVRASPDVRHDADKKSQPSDSRYHLPTTPEKSVQQPIGDDHTELILPTSHNPSVITTVAGNGVRGSIKD